MTKTIPCGTRKGKISAPSSKSAAHRLIIAAALSSQNAVLTCNGLSNDILATVNCLNQMGAQIKIVKNRLQIVPICRTKLTKKTVVLPCKESGTTLRLLLPVVGALGLSAVFEMEGRLPNRPLSPLDELLRQNGMKIEKKQNKLCVCGKLSAGRFCIAGNVSSQFVSGLLFALPLLEKESQLDVTGKVESVSYITMTEHTLKQSNICFEKSGFTYTVSGAQTYHLPTEITVEGDYSNAAFFLSMGAFSAAGITVTGLDLNSLQGDREIVALLQQFGADVKAENGQITVCKNNLNGITIHAEMIPDLVPVLATVAAVANGTTHIVGAARLRLKESDRLETTCKLLQGLGADIKTTDDGLCIKGVPTLKGGTANSFGDHRIAMAAAVAAFAAQNPITLCGAECVAKSYPDFFEDFNTLEEEK